jgi:hypothetical protein
VVQYIPVEEAAGRLVVCGGGACCGIAMLDRLIGDGNMLKVRCYLHKLGICRLEHLLLWVSCWKVAAFATAGKVHCYC